MCVCVCVCVCVCFVFRGNCPDCSFRAGAAAIIFMNIHHEKLMDLNGFVMTSVNLRPELIE